MKGTCTRTLVQDLYQVGVALHLNGRALSILVVKEIWAIEYDMRLGIETGMSDRYISYYYNIIPDRTSSA